MNKEKVINELVERTNMSKEQCLLINDLLETTGFIGKKNKEEFIDKLMNELNIDEKSANNIYETFMDIIKDGIKDKLKHPFKNIEE